MTTIGTPLTPSTTRVLLCGGEELGIPTSPYRFANERAAFERTVAAIGLPIPATRQYGPAASSVILANGASTRVSYGNLELALQEADTQLRLFGEPEVSGQRRMGVALARGPSLAMAREKAQQAAAAVAIQL